MADTVTPERLLAGVPRIESPFFDEIFARLDPDAETLRVARDLHDRGFAVIDFPDEDFERHAEAIKHDLGERFDLGAWRKKGGSMRIQDAWTFHPDVRALAVNKHILELLSLLYGRSAWPFQTLNFPVGTQQPRHTDAVHFHSMPERFMCGVWVALEDVELDSGPLIYYPGSHKLPIYDNDQLGVEAADLNPHPGQRLYQPLWDALVAKHGLQPQRFAARKGQALVWTANLLHGGARHDDRSRTRWSQVTHYYFDDCVYYTPMHSNPAAGRIDRRWPRNVLDGRPVRSAGVLRRILHRLRYGG
ncbi:MAG TPA: phytanoyl-CoA dioxygenase family protein [Rhodanobacteraceae bacterium]|jgi:hypothetical protein|nr:phytanoyl-CoA dioxygenase family protein [Rhodanobacteraceae bacterium]